MRRPDPSDAELPLRIRATRHSRRELEKLLVRARRAIDAFATSRAAEAGSAEEPEPPASAPARLVSGAVAFPSTLS